LAASTPPIVPLPGFAAEQRAVVHRFEGELLAVFRQQLLDLGQRRAGLCRQHQFGRLVERDAGEFRQIKRVFALQRPADAALGAMAEDFERRAPSATSAQATWGKAGERCRAKRGGEGEQHGYSLPLPDVENKFHVGHDLLGKPSVRAARIVSQMAPTFFSASELQNRRTEYPFARMNSSRHLSWLLSEC
jgi:hypothetical protein